MRKKYSSSGKNKTKIAIVLAAIYFFGVFLGCFIVWAIPVYKSKAELLDLSGDKGIEVLSAGTIEPPMIFGMEYMMYDASGKMITLESQFLQDSHRAELKKYLPTLFENGELYQPTFFCLSDNEDPTVYIFAIIIGSVVETPSGKQFASMLVRDLPDVVTSMVVYVLLFTLMFLLALTYIFVILQKERELNHMRRDLIANVSHELKTPITAIRAMAEVLHDGMAKDKQEQQHYSSKIIEESDRLEQMVLDILELSKLQSKRTDFQKNHIQADELFPPVIDRYMMLCGDLGITFDLSGFDMDAIPSLYSDEDKLISLISILLDNALKFTGRGGTVWLSAQMVPKHVIICIRDNGPGIHPEDLPRIFDRFYKADIAHNSKGSGLGLAIADEIVKGLGEKLYVESTYGVGSAFYFTVGYLK